MRRHSPGQPQDHPLSIRSAVLALLGALALTGAFAPGLRAQGVGIDSIGALGSLLDQIEALQGRRSGATEMVSPIDRARQRRPVGGPATADRPSEAWPAAAEADDTDQLLERFCAGTAERSDDLLRIVARNLSRLEADYCLRARQVLRQYGYDVFATAVEPGRLAVGAVGDDYVLGVGDELVVSFHGQVALTVTTAVDREGRVILPDLPPIAAAGRSFGRFRRELEARTKAALLGTQVFASVANLRLLSVMVVGEVARPGTHQVTGLASIVDALGAAGGVKPTGSLRMIQVQRGNRVQWVDLYDLLFGLGQSHQLGVMDGDRIVVPSIGPTIGIAGDVKRRGVYELPEGRSALRAAQALAFACRPMRPRGNRFLQITFQDSGGQLVVEHGGDMQAGVRDGDILVVQRRQDVQAGTVELAGHVRVPGPRALAQVQTVKGLVQSTAAMRDNPYLPFAVLETTDPTTQARRLFPVDLQAILAGGQDFRLREFDRLIVLGAEDIRYLSSPDVQEIIFSSETARLFALPETDAAAPPRFALPTVPGDAVDESAATGGEGIAAAAGPRRPDDAGEEDGVEVAAPVCDGLVRLTEIVQGGRSGRYANAVRLADGDRQRMPSVRLPCPEIFESEGQLLPFALEHVVAVNGEVRRPGAYPVADETSLDALVAVAGGLTQEVDLTRLELSRFDPDSYKGLSENSREMIDLSQTAVEKVAVSPGDVVRFNPVFTDRDVGPVVLLGEFVRPGIYEIRRGETLSQMMRRAGGLTAQAYPYGAIFLRERVRRAEQQGFLRASRELSSALTVTAIQRGVDPSALLTLQQISDQLSKLQAIGRVVIEADPTVLQVRAELDTVLEPGDRILIPKRPNFVSIIGDVLNPGAQQFVPGTKGDRYIRQAGGFQRSADQDRVFVVYPNGQAQPLSLSAWNYRPVQIPPGSTIVVPKDPAPFDFLTFAREVTDLVSKVALTAASLSVLVTR